MTNECIEAVVAGLDPHEDDTIIAVCNRGEMPLAFLEFAGRVIGVDISLTAIDRATSNVLSVSLGKSLMTFLSENEYYFRAEGRLDRIRGRLNRLMIKEGNILTEMNQSGITKVYLSNIFTYEYWDNSWNGLDSVGETTQALSSGCLVYISDGPKNFENYHNHLYSQGLEIDAHRTKRAQELEKDLGAWKPIVLRRL